MVFAEAVLFLQLIFSELKKIVLIPLFFILTFSLRAQGDFMTVVPQAPVIVGESFQVQYIIEDGGKISNFKPASFENFRLVAGPNIYTGSVTKRNEVKQLRNLVYTLAAIKAGRFIIGGATVTVNGKTKRSNDVVVDIISRETAKRLNKDAPTINSGYFLQPGEDPYEKIRKNLFLKMTVNKKTCFVGEPVLATFKLYSRLESRSDIVKNPGFYGFTVFDMINLADNETATEYVQGKLFDVHTIRKVQLYPLREGSYTIDAMEVKNKVEFSRSAVNKKTEQEIVEGMLKTDTNEMKNTDAEIFESNIGTKPVVITVKSTPVKSKPVTFNGAIGVFNISAYVIKDSLKRNEEGALEISISGKGNFIQLNAPVIEWPEGIEGFEPIVKDILDKTQSPLTGSRAFRYAFVSARPGTYTIPSIGFSFFDPDSGGYKMIKSDALKVSVSNEEVVSHTNPEISTKINNPEKKYWLIGIVALLLVSIGIYFFFVKRKGTPDSKPAETSGSLRALSINEILEPSLLTKSIEDKDFYNSLHKSVWKFFNYYFNLSGSEMNKKNLTIKLQEKNISRKLIEDTLQILQQCETGMFTNALLIGNRNELLRQTRKLIEEINSLLASPA